MSITNAKGICFKTKEAIFRNDCFFFSKPFHLSHLYQIVFGDLPITATADAKAFNGGKRYIDKSPYKQKSTLMPVASRLPCKLLLALIGSEGEEGWRRTRTFYFFGRALFVGRN